MHYKTLFSNSKIFKKYYPFNKVKDIPTFQKTYKVFESQIFNNYRFENHIITIVTCSRKHSLVLFNYQLKKKISIFQKKYNTFKKSNFNSCCLSAEKFFRFCTFKKKRILTFQKTYKAFEKQILAVVAYSSSIFCAALYMISIFLQILRNVLKFSLVGKRIIQIKINLRQFLIIVGNVLEFFCISFVYYIRIFIVSIH